LNSTEKENRPVENLKDERRTSQVVLKRESKGGNTRKTVV